MMNLKLDLITPLKHVNVDYFHSKTNWFCRTDEQNKSQLVKYDPADECSPEKDCLW